MVTVNSLPSAGPQPPSRSHPHPRDRTLAIATVALLLSGVFDVGRALYCRYRLSYAVTQSASLLAGRPVATTSNDANGLSAAAADLVRRISGRAGCDGGISLIAEPSTEFVDARERGLALSLRVSSPGLGR